MTNKDALVSRETLRHLSDHYSLEAVKKVVFSEMRIDTYKNIFQGLLQKKIIVDCSFEECRWILNVTDSGNRAIINFDLEVYEKINLSLKCYALQKITNNINIINIQTNINYLKLAIIQSFGFSKDKANVLEEYISELGHRKRAKMCYAIIEFLKFYPLNESEIYTEIATQFANSKSNTRDLPPFHDVLMFDELIMRYFSECTLEDSVKFSLVYFWWNLTKIIPMRPVEFYGLTRDCIRHEEDTYWLVLPRAKQSPRKSEEIAVTDTLQINYELYEIIRKYRDLSESYMNVGNPNLLLSYDIYRSFCDFTTSKLTKKRAIDSIRFHKTIRKFYLEVIKGRYGYEVSDQLTAGDNRHFAFCNMMLQGFNMLSIARMGGHKTLSVQMHYHAHLDHFAESAVQILAQSYYKSKKSFAKLSLDKEIIIRSKVFNKSDYKQLYEVDFGYCTDHPSRCKVGDCRLCEHYLFSTENKQEGYLWLKDFSEVLSRRVREQVQFMISISSQMEYSLKTLEYPIHKQEQLSGSANELRRLMDQKAMVDSILLGEFENESK
ncbi:integrase [Paenibacillus sp. LjRoot153]|uniref:integrase n=1 Tax=Paenibacillus sp. LjRoot153 TaxID=3342270 RepID=UPI003ED08F48